MSTLNPATPVRPPIRLSQEKPATQTTALRLGAAAVLALSLLAFLLGTAWDIQWHVAVGRDRVFTAPHILMLFGIALAGLTSLTLVLIESWRARQGNGAVHAENSSRILGLFQAPAGIILAGIGALLAGIAFPLDDYWHVLYGIDVTLWAPFHVMIIAGPVMVGLGIVYTLASEMNRMNDGRTRQMVQAGIAVALALTMATIMLLLPQANVAEGLLLLAGAEFVWGPILLAFMLPLGLATAVAATRLPGAATILSSTFLVLRYMMLIFVPWATETTRLAQGLAYRPNPPEMVITSFAYPGLALLLAALVIDAAYWLAPRRGETGLRLLWVATVFTAVFMTAIHQPWATSLPTMAYPNLDVDAAYRNTLPFITLAALAGTALAALMNRGMSAIRH